jgi:hypothetical protein
VVPATWASIARTVREYITSIARLTGGATYLGFLSG